MGWRIDVAKGNRILLYKKGHGQRQRVCQKLALESLYGEGMILYFSPYAGMSWPLARFYAWPPDLEQASLREQTARIIPLLKGGNHLLGEGLARVKGFFGKPASEPHA